MEYDEILELAETQFEQHITALILYEIKDLKFNKKIRVLSGIMSFIDMLILKVKKDEDLENEKSRKYNEILKLDEMLELEVTDIRDYISCIIKKYKENEDLENEKSRKYNKILELDETLELEVTDIKDYISYLIKKYK